MKEPIIIVGAGLSGLHAASLLIAQGIECRVLEARGRIGGRVLSEIAADKPECGRFDLGPTWFWPQHEPVIANLIEELNLKTFTQHTEGAVLLEQSSHSPIQRRVLTEGAVVQSVRVIGGIQSLVDAVSATFPPGIVELNTRVKAIHMDQEGNMTLDADCMNGKKKSIRASGVILALPPRIVAHHITLSPSLPSELMTNLINKPTWMAGHAKAVAIYDRPFWREDGLSGQAMSWGGPLQEIHDASPVDAAYGAIFGFFGMPANIRQELGETTVRNDVVDQLTHLFGPSAQKPISLLYKDWSSDPDTAVESDTEPLVTFPNYGRLTNTGVWKNKLVFAGTETAPQHGGHLEGALQSAERAVYEILHSDKTHL